MTGSNDLAKVVGHGTRPSQVASDLQALMHEATVRFPRSRLHVCTIFKRHDIPESILDDTNDSIRNYASQTSTSIIDLATRITTADLHDGIHTKPMGTAKVARALTYHLKNRATPNQQPRPKPYARAQQSVSNPTHSTRAQPTNTQYSAAANQSRHVMSSASQPSSQPSRQPHEPAHWPWERHYIPTIITTQPPLYHGNIPAWNDQHPHNDYIQPNNNTIEYRVDNTYTRDSRFWPLIQENNGQ